MGLIRNLFASSLIAVILSGCNFKNPACNNQHVSVIQPGPKKGEDTFVKFEAYPSYIRYNHENFGDSSRVEIGCFRFYNWGNMESYFKIPNPSFLNSSTIDSVVFSLYGKAYHTTAFTANGVIEDWEENEIIYDNKPASNSADYDIQVPDTCWGWTSWDLGRIIDKGVNGVVVRPLEYGSLWFSDYVGYSSDEMDSIQFRPKWTFYYRD